MRKKVVALILVLISLMLLTSCISKIDPSKIEKEKEEVEEKEEVKKEVEEKEEIEEKEEVKEEVPAKSIPKKTVKEGDLVNFPKLKAVDPDGDKIKYTFSSPLNEKGEWQTKKGDEGEYKVTITASDGTNTVKQEVLIVIKGENKPPVLDVPKEIKVIEGKLAKITAKIDDPNKKDTLALSFGNPFNKDGNWQTKKGDEGVYNVVVKVSDGELEDSKVVKVIIESMNKAPVITIDETITVSEGDTVTLDPEVADPEGDEFSISYSGWMTSDNRKTDYGDEGEHFVTITAEDAGGHKTTKKIKILVENKNRAPEFLPGSFE